MVFINTNHKQNNFTNKHTFQPYFEKLPMESHYTFIYQWWKITKYIHSSIVLGCSSYLYCISILSYSSSAPSI